MAVGTATLDFGATPTDTGSVLVGGLSGLSVGTHKEAFIQGDDSTGDNTTDAHQQLAARAQLCCEYVSATSMTISADVLVGFASGTFTVHWVTA